MRRGRPLGRTEVHEIIRYGSVTVGSQLFLVVMTWALVEWMRVDPQVAYVIALTATYAGVYMASARWVFRVTPTWSNARRFLIALGAFYGLNLVAFTVFYQVLGLPYLLAMILNILVLGPLRYLANKHLVYAPPREPAGTR